MTKSWPSSAGLRSDLLLVLPDLRAYARFLVRDRHEADDLVQDALVRGLAALDQFQHGTSLRAWLFTILRNVFYEQARKRQIERRALDRSPPAEALEASPQVGQAKLQEVERLIWQLSPLLREALVLVGAQGLDYEEAAAVCGVPVGTVKARVSRARRLLARAVEGQLP
jgi:RNA polymerase sigma-70 factor (ECF subfamily)